MHGNDHARHDPLCHIKSGIRLDRQNAAGGDHQHIAALDLLDLLRSGGNADVAHMHGSQTVGLKNMDGVHPAHASLERIVIGLHCGDRKGTLFSAAQLDALAIIMIAMIVAPFGILSAFLGMAARIWFPEMANAKLALPALLQNMPVLTAGLVTAAMTAAILSTAAPILLACGTLFTKDVYLRLHPGLSSRKELQVSRIATLTAGVLCVLMAILMYYSATVLDIVYFAYSLRGSLFVILLFGIFSRKQKPQENPTIAAMILTAATGLFWTVWKAYTGSYPIAPWVSDTYASICTAVLSMTIVCFAMPARAKNK